MELNRVIFILSLLLCLETLAQESVIPMFHQEALEQGDSSTLVHAFVKADMDELQRFVLNSDGTFKYVFGEYGSVALPASELMELSEKEWVDAIHFELGEGKPLLNSSLVTTQVTSVHQGLGGLPDSYTGKGVIVGVIDAGIELNHPDFRNTDGSTRVIELWDQTMAFDSSRTPTYGYGQVWDSVDINDSLCPHEDQAIWYGHGTNTAGIAASNGLSDPDFTGVAPESELIIVSSDFSSVGWTNTIADAVHYIFSRAEELGKPCVINASLGTYIGTHDATDLPAQFIESLIDAEPGRLLVCAAGNAGGEDPFHLGYTANGDTHFTWIEVPAGAASGASFGFELFGDSNDFERVQFSIGADKVNPYYAFRGETEFDSVLNRMNFIYYDSIISPSGNYISEVKTYAYIVNGVYRLQVLIDNIDSIDYNFRLSIAGHGSFDTWIAEWLGYADMVSSGLPSTNEFSDIASYELPDLTQSIVSSWACSEKVITVGNAINRNQYTDVDEETVILSGQIPGGIATSSSRGPTRKGVLKPESVAPGDNTLTAGAFFQLNALLANPATRERVALGGLHHRAGGTSSASPVIAGIGALYFEKCPNGNWEDFKEALLETSYGDQLTGSLPNVQWGMGKVDALGLMQFSTPRPSVESISTDFCAGDSLSLSLSDNYPIVTWSSGDSLSVLMVTNSGLYSALVVNDDGCEGFSDTIAVFRRPIPAKPSIQIDKALPACFGESVKLSLGNEFGAYEWSDGSFTDFIEVSDSGTFYCVVRNAFGCSNISDTVSINFYDESPAPVLHLQTGSTLYALLDSGLATSYSWYANGVFQSTTSEPNLSISSSGIYSTSYTDSNGCEIFSDDLMVYALGIQDNLKAGIHIWPKPMTDELNLSSEQVIDRWRLINSIGQITDQRSSGQTKETIDVSDLPKGVYLLILETGGVEVSEKLIK